MMWSSRATTALALLLLATPAWAQPRPRPAAAPTVKQVEEQLKNLSARVDEAMKAAADSAAALKGLQEVQRKLTELQQETERSKTVRRGYDETRRMLEQHERRIDNLELQLAAIRLQIAGKAELAGFDEGFFLQSSNRRFLFRVGALLQAAYEGTIYDDARTYSDSGLGQNASTFLLRRALLAIGGHVFSPVFAYRLELEYGSVDPGPVLEGYADFRPHRLLSLSVGKQKVPISRQFLTHSSQLEFVDRSGAVLSFVPGWDIGAMLHGELELKGLLSYQVGIFNGAGSHALENDNIDFLYAVRLVYEPLGPMVLAEGDPEVSPFRMALGVSFNYNLVPTDVALRKGVSDVTAAAALQDKDGDGEIDNVGVYTLGVELTARIASLSWQNELFFRREDPGAIGGDEKLWGDYWGVYTQLGLFPWHQSLELAARYSFWEPNNYGQPRTVLLPGRVHELAAVANLLVWKRMLKLQLEYDHQWQRDLRSLSKSLDAINVNLVRLQLQAAF